MCIDQCYMYQKAILKMYVYQTTVYTVYACIFEFHGISCFSASQQAIERYVIPAA